MKFTLRGGKRIRPLLLIAGYRAIGGKDIERARKASVSMELIQDMLLIHDDIMDLDEERRGGPTFHKVFEKYHMSRGFSGDHELFGRNMSIIAGDLAESLAVEALAGSGFPAERVRDALSCQARMVRDTGFGQILDLLSEFEHEWNEGSVMAVHRLKTARYTIEGPLLIRALLHGADEEQLSMLSGYAIPVGIAFQITDDIMGLYGRKSETGKSNLTDLEQGKRTLLIVKGLELANHDDGRMITDKLGRRGLTAEEAEEIRRVIGDCGSLDYSRELASRLVEKGIEAIDSGLINEQMADLLVDLARYVIRRTE